jgi:hypothetical protein
MIVRVLSCRGWALLGNFVLGAPPLLSFNQTKLSTFFFFFFFFSLFFFLIKIYLPMSRSESLHRVSDHLSDRHPYLQEPFPRGVFPLEIAAAHGHRAFPKLDAVLRQPGLSPGAACDALETACGLLTTQESKVQAVTAGLVATASVLLATEADDDDAPAGDG